MHLVEYVQLLGIICLIVTLIGGLIGGVYLALCKRPVEIGVLALVVMLIASFFVWFVTKDYGDGPHSPLMLIVPLVLLPMACIMVGIMLSLLTRFLRGRKLAE